MVFILSFLAMLSLLASLAGVVHAQDAGDNIHPPPTWEEGQS